MRIRGATGALLLAACAAPASHPAAFPTPEVRAVTAPLTLRSVDPSKPAVPSHPTFVTVCAGGDVMLGSNLDTAWARAAQARLGLPTLLPNPDSLLAPLQPLVADADVVLLNVEGAIGTGPVARKCRPGSSRCYAFRQDPAAADALGRFAGPAAMAGNVANNHAMDAGPGGFAATLRHLEDAGVHPVGSDTLPALVPLPDGDTLAILGFSVFSAGPDARNLRSVTRHVSRAAERFPRVVVSLHMGAEGVAAQRTRDAPERFAGEDRGNPVAIARAAAAAGADLVVGHGPHVLRAVEWQGDALIVYSLGNLVTYGPFSLSPPLDRGALLCAELDPQGRVALADIRSTYQVRPGRAFPDPTRTADGIVDSLSRIDFPETGARVSAGMLRYPIAP